MIGIRMKSHVTVAGSTLFGRCGASEPAATIEPQVLSPPQ
jgi:hypothetical protein